VGDYSSPLVRPGQADGLIALKLECVALHRHFLRKDGWIVANAPAISIVEDENPVATIDADPIALSIGDPRSVNLILLGHALAQPGRLFCSGASIEEAICRKSAGKKARAENALTALRGGLNAVI